MTQFLKEKLNYFDQSIVEEIFNMIDSDTIVTLDQFTMTLVETRNRLKKRLTETNKKIEDHKH
jgi:hypothetical protein